MKHALLPIEAMLVTLAEERLRQDRQSAQARFDAAVSPLLRLYGVSGPASFTAGDDGVIALEWAPPTPDAATLSEVRDSLLERERTL